MYMDALQKHDKFMKHVIFPAAFAYDVFHWTKIVSGR